MFAAEERHLHYLSSAPTGAHTDSLSRETHIIKLHDFSLLSYFVCMKLYNSPNYLDGFTMASNVKASLAIRVTDNE